MVSAFRGWFFRSVYMVQIFLSRYNRFIWDRYICSVIIGLLFTSLYLGWIFIQPRSITCKHKFILARKISGRLVFIYYYFYLNIYVYLTQINILSLLSTYKSVQKYLDQKKTDLKNRPQLSMYDIGLLIFRPLGSIQNFFLRKKLADS